MKKKHLYALHIVYVCCLGLLVSCEEKVEPKNSHLERGQATLDSIYKYYSAPNPNLLRETYPFDDQYSATYLASNEAGNAPNEYSYLWPYSGTLSAVNTLLEATGDNKYKELLENKVLPGLEEYFDNKRNPDGYASYINSAPESDRFYDDNVWLGIDFTDIYQMTKQPEYLAKAKLIWEFVASGMDEKLDGGIYWCEQKKESKNTCSNAPGSVFALKLFEATKDSIYFKHGAELYDWTRNNLQDSTDLLYFDNIRLDGKIGEAKYAYNSGQMMQAASLLYKLTNDEKYLTDAQNLAKGCTNYFFADFTTPDGGQMKLLKKTDVWFIAVMFRGYVELYNADKDATYIDIFRQNLDYAWNHSRAHNGLFSTDWSGEEQDNSKWLLTQAAMVEMYGRLATLDK